MQNFLTQGGVQPQNHVHVLIYLDLTLVLPSRFCNMVYQGGWLPLPYEFEINGPKYDCLVPWYRVGSPLSIDTKIMKKIMKKKSIFFTKKFQISEFHPVCLLIKKKNGISNMSWKFQHYTMQIFFKMAT